MMLGRGSFTAQLSSRNPPFGSQVGEKLASNIMMWLILLKFVELDQVCERVGGAVTEYYTLFITFNFVSVHMIFHNFCHLLPLTKKKFNFAWAAKIGK